MHSLTRTLLAAVAGACAALAALAALTLYRPSIILDMDVDIPRPVMSGFHPVERTPDSTFVWTRAHATVTLRGLDRRVEWLCTTRLRGARPAGVPQARVALAIDGVTSVSREPGDAYEDVAVTVPRRPGSSSASLTISTSPVYKPASDPRELGVMVDEIQCAPAGGAVKPTTAALTAAAASGAVLGVFFAHTFAAVVAAGAATGLFSVALALLLTTGIAAYSRAYLGWFLPTVLWTAGGAGAVVAYAHWRRAQLHPAARFVLGFSAGVLCLKILALLHPAKHVVDAVFQAHRLEAVLGGSYYFTQPMPGGVQFPYAIALYVVAAPWASLITDHVALLRIVVCVAEALAAAMLYVAITRAWGDRLIGALAVVLYHAAPLSYVTIGNANLTFAFGQSVATMAVAAAVIWNGERRPWAAGVGLFALSALAFLSHVGVFPLVGLTLVATGVLYAVAGGPGLRRPSRVIVAASILAALFAVGSYYAHFPEVYRTLGRVSAAGPTDATPAPAPLPVSARATRAAWIAGDAYGSPLLGLALLGVAGVRRRDRLSLALAGWGISCAVFLAFRVLAPVDAPFQRYADEFIHRVYGMTLPAVAILAACASAWAWRKGAAWRLAAGLAGLAILIIAVKHWLAWFR